MKFVEIEFENAGAATTETIVGELLSNVAYDHVTGCAGCLIGATAQDISKFTSQVQDIVWKHNGGMFCEVTVKTEAEIDHLL